MRRFGLFALLVIVAGVAALLIRTPGAPPDTVDLELAPLEQTVQFELALEPVELEYPRDHGAHFGFQTEWWYFTGNLTSDDDQHFGYQLTIFRRGLQPGRAQRESELASNHLYFAHLALTDLGRQEHRAFERFSRGAEGLAAAATDRMQVYLEDWTIRQGEQVIELSAAEADLELELALTPRKPPVAHGESGLSAKGLQPGNASYYVSLTSLDTEGWIVTRGQRYPVRGSSWFDHEWGTSALGSEAVGWDWFSLQLEDGRELMLFQLRRRAGSIEPVSSGTVVAVSGVSRTLTLEQMQLSVLDTWVSPATGAEYPIGWRVQVPDEGLDLQVEALLPDQENSLEIVYWEGAVGVSGSHRGFGYLELTGYGVDIQGLY